MTSPSARTSHLTELRGTRYGEILLITSQAGQLTAVVYNTTGLNDCPPATWRSLDPRRARQGLRGTGGPPERPAVLDAGPDRRPRDRRGPVLRRPGRPAGRRAAHPARPGPGRRARRTVLLRHHDPAGNRVDLRRRTAGVRAADPGREDLRDAGVLAHRGRQPDPGLAARPGRQPAPPGRLAVPHPDPDRDLTLRAVAGGAHVLQDELQNTYMRLMTV